MIANKQSCILSCVFINNEEHTHTHTHTHTYIYIYIYIYIRLYFYSWRWYLCGAEKQSQRVHAHEGVGRRKSQWTSDFSQNSGTYIVYNSHVTCSNSSFSLTMVTPTSHFFAFYWLCAQARFCGRTHLPPSPNSTTSTGHIPISSAGCTCLNIHRYTAPVGMITFLWSHRSYQSTCQQHPLYSHQQVTLRYYTPLHPIFQNVHMVTLYVQFSFSPISPHKIGHPYNVCVHYAPTFL